MGDTREVRNSSQVICTKDAEGNHRNCGFVAGPWLCCLRGTSNRGGNRGCGCHESARCQATEGTQVVRCVCCQGFDQSGPPCDGPVPGVQKVLQAHLQAVQKTPRYRPLRHGKEALYYDDAQTQRFGEASSEACDQEALEKSEPCNFAHDEEELEGLQGLLRCLH